MQASAMRAVTSLIARIASSLPGIGKLIWSGSQLVSVMATSGMPSFLASFTAMSSSAGSIRNTAPGRPFMFLMPPMYSSRRMRSFSSMSVSFLGRFS